MSCEIKNSHVFAQCGMCCGITVVLLLSLAIFRMGLPVLSLALPGNA